MPRRNRKPVPIDPDDPTVRFAGRWVARDDGRKTVLAHSETLAELIQITSEKGIENPLLERLPRCDAYLVGGHRVTTMIRTAS